MVFSIVAGILIFGYAGWTIYRHIQKSKKGKCAGCALEKTSSCGCGDHANPLNPKLRG
ncbi:FeoB-associated Cys-rich membrane protein [Gorillibacterium massiliense]|uniref:FeoB-associated Cys-rich membrane protein n=1 Tax=Gorillibacterium massiliense TaxID=1280390 RepID=UPI0004ACF525|nr:FeoB-associated Cys-rich membrane protein [Gorillibacterium massiliense]